VRRVPLDKVEEANRFSMRQALFALPWGSRCSYLPGGDKMLPKSPVQ
jgi:hypothetical protein